MKEKLASIFYVLIGALVATLNCRGSDEGAACYEGNMYFAFFMKVYLALCVVLFIHALRTGDALLPLAVVSVLIVLICGAHIQPQRIQCLLQDVKHYCVLMFIFILAVAAIITFGCYDICRRSPSV